MAQEGASRTFDMHSWEGLTDLLKAAREAGLESDQYQDFRDVVLRYAQSGGDPELKAKIDSVIADYRLGHPPDTDKTEDSKDRQQQVSEKTKTSRPKPVFKAPTPASAQSTPTPPPVAQPAPAADPVPAAPVAQPAPTPATQPTPPEPPATPTPTPAPATPAQPAPVAQPAAATPEPPATPTPTPAAQPAPTPASNPAEIIHRSPDEHKVRIASIKREVQSTIGNPITLVDSGNPVGKEYMNALLKAMRSLAGGGAPGTLDAAMADLEIKRVALLAAAPTPAQPTPTPTPTPAPVAQPAPVAEPTPVAETTQPVPEPASKSVPVQSTPEPTPAPEPVTRAAEQEQAEAPKRQKKLLKEKEASNKLSSLIPPLTEQADPVTQPKPAVSEPATEKKVTATSQLEKKDEQKKESAIPPQRQKDTPPPTKSEPQEKQSQTKPDSSNSGRENLAAALNDLDAPTAVPAPTSETKQNTETQAAKNPASEEKPTWGSSRVKHDGDPEISEVKVRVPDTIKKQDDFEKDSRWSTNKFISKGVAKRENDPTLFERDSQKEANTTGAVDLMSQEVTNGLGQLLNQWPLFQRSGLFGTGPSGIDHPLYKKLSNVTVSDVLAGKFDKADDEIIQTIKDYMNAWRNEQGISHTMGETFEHYLRRVVVRVLRRQK